MLIGEVRVDEAVGRFELAFIKQPKTPIRELSQAETLVLIGRVEGVVNRAPLAHVEVSRLGLVPVNLLAPRAGRPVNRAIHGRTVSR